MTKRVLVLEGNSLARQREAAKLGVRSASGIYCEAVAEHFPDLALDVLHGADRGQSPPGGASIEDYDALIVGGSGLHAYSQDFEVTNQIDVLRTYARTGKPILGSCWGLQIAVIAAGGTVELSPNGREVGIARKLRKVGDGESHRFLAGRPAVFDAPCIHYDEVRTLPEGSVLLARNDHSEVQAAIVPVERSQVWAVQYHPEFDLPHLGALSRLYADAMVEQGFFADHAELDSHNALLERAHAGDRAAAWQLGVDEDVLDPENRHAEIIAWIEAQVLV